MEQAKKEYIRGKMNPLKRTYADLKEAWNRKFGSIAKNYSPIKYNSIDKSISTMEKAINNSPVDTKVLQTELNNIKRENQTLPQKAKASSAYESFTNAISRFAAAIFSLGKSKEADIDTKQSMTFMSSVPKTPTVEEAKAQRQSYRASPSGSEKESAKRPRSQSLADIRNPAPSEVEAKVNLDQKPKGRPRSGSFSR
jgi:hypothetical protein